MQSLFLVLDTIECIDFRTETMRGSAYLEVKASKMISLLNSGHATLIGSVNKLGPEQGSVHIGDAVDKSFMGIHLVTAKKLTTMLNSGTHTQNKKYLHIMLSVEQRPTYTGRW